MGGGGKGGGSSKAPKMNTAPAEYVDTEAIITTDAEGNKTATDTFHQDYVDQVTNMNKDRYQAAPTLNIMGEARGLQI